MNELIKTMLEPRSIRSYSDKPVEEELLSQIIQSVQNAPNWVNMQHTTIIVIRDKARRKKLSQLCGNQKHIAQAPIFLVFCADFYRTELACQKYGQDINQIMGDIDNVIVAAHETGIALGTAVVAAESLGLGTVPIGDVRLNALEIIKMLDLPKFVIPVLGLCIGYAADNPEQKPRLPKKAVCFDEVYNRNLTEMLEKYDETYEEYLKKRSGNNRIGNWTERAAKFYRYPYNHYPEAEEMLKQQGFIK